MRTIGLFNQIALRDLIAMGVCIARENLMSIEKKATDSVGKWGIHILKLYQHGSELTHLTQLFALV